MKSSSPSPIPRKEPSSARLTVLADVPASRLRPPSVAARRVMLMTILQLGSSLSDYTVPWPRPERYALPDRADGRSGSEPVMFWLRKRLLLSLRKPPSYDGDAPPDGIDAPKWRN